MIASASKDKSVKLWNLNGKESKSWKNLDSEEDVISVRFSPDGQLIASASDKKVKIWSVDGTLLTTFERLGSEDVAFSPDGKAIAAAGNSNVAVWNFDLDELLEYGCNWARDYLKNNPKAKSDRTLCDDIPTHK
jgi:WD40 repeat protein